MTPIQALMPSTDPAARAIVRVGVAVVASILLAVALTDSLAGQQIRGRLVNTATNRFLHGAFIVLLDADSNEVGRVLTDDGGRFRITAPTAGRFRLQSQIVGVQSAVSEPIQVEWGQTVDYRFEIPGLKVVLPRVIVEGQRTCRSVPQGGIATAILWGEAQKALQAVAWTESQQVLRVRTVRYDRELDPRTLDITGEQNSWHQSGLYTGGAFHSPSADRLAQLGYIQETESEEWIYYGPDANALLSDAFAGTHCFLARQADASRPDLIGLAFEPVPDRDLPDVQGILWVDPGSGELRSLDFRYTDPPWDVSADRIGGHVEFEHLANGPWIVRSWWLRIPVIGIRARTTGPVRVRGERETVLAAIREVGGWVNEIETVTGRPVSRAGGSTLRGTVTDGDTGEPLRGATVSLVGTAYEATTDDSGQFVIHDVVQKTYGVTFSHESLEDLGFVPPPTEVTVGRDTTLTVDLVVPLRSAIWAKLCPRSDPEGGGAIVSGFVRDRRLKQPVAEVFVKVGGDPEKVDPNAETIPSRSSMTDWSGYYRVCDVVTNVPLRAVTGGTQWEEAGYALELEPGQLYEQDFELREREVIIVRRERSNIAMGANVGMVSPGDAGSLLKTAPSVNAFARWITVSGFQFGGGFRYAVHGIENTREKYRQSAFYLEPRFAFRMVSKTLTPFIGVRSGLVLEAVWQGDGDFTGTGVELGVSAGITYNLDRRIQLEVGAGLGATRFSDFSHDKAGLWTNCLDALQDSGEDLPHTVQSCSPPNLNGPAVSLERSVQHPGSGRRDRWWGLWLGFVAPLFEPG
jgi:hypothetical protein